MSKTISYAVSIRKIAENINPEWTLDDWFQWPPNMFALCAQILNRTGLYKATLMNTDWWNRKDWEKEIDELGKQWIKHTSNRLLGNSDRSKFRETGLLKEWYDTLKKDWDNENDPTDVDHLRALGNLYKGPEDRDKTSEGIRMLGEALIQIYILADSSCSGLGFLGQHLKKENLENRIFMATANLLLNNTGSLSTTAKFHGVVVPKMRTPQSGLITRSLGHHLTFHTTEVEVVWRTFPRLEDGNKSLNILAVPYPWDVEPTDFIVVPDNYHPVRYFMGNIKKDIHKEFLLGLVRKVWELAESNNHVDIIVLPEMALSEIQYNYLLAEFKSAFQNQNGSMQLPAIVTGIMKKNLKQTGYAGVDEPFQNEVRMEVFFSGNWYTTTQRKHHRWQLDRQQIHQYELEAHLAADRRWFEYSSIAQRRLTILAPNSWMALTALICEDLARQEPVGEVIRGIGPTLLMALLSDGPQLTSRWPARYANVLADDPGTAVLSLTSLGMAQRSKAPKDVPSLPEPVVGLWKDMFSGWKQLAMPKQFQALLFTVTAKFEEEFTLDARSDGRSAAVFQLENIDPKRIEIKSAELPKSSVTEAPDSKTERDEKFNNIRELSAVQFAADAILDMLCCKNFSGNDFDKATRLILHLLAGEESLPPSYQHFRERIVSRIEQAWEDPAKLGTAASAGKQGNVKMSIAAKDLRKLINICHGDTELKTADLYDLLIQNCHEMLLEAGRKPEENLTPLTILYNLHNRVTSWHPAEKDCFEIDGLDVSRAQKMKAVIMSHINEKRKQEAIGSE
ncbi:hypothetical protein SAMN05428975_5648 [Mucilaginibacter sp. OK268]|uniref:hypothetical protein n=1 Tax=Mucilaginibacter sp. OK268 TaxID=1881048 RepID=UPI0008889FD0|nr:hypothetical protein [Mucilaginibacter sp. OK268]SDQ01211.1 hypothetical protein SAMN05428975_5648 [Mucilaginibacter sp. OK268]